VREPVSEAQLDCWLDTLRHLRCAGLAATLPAHVGALPVEGDPEVEQRTGECVIGGALAYEPHPRNRIGTTLKANTCFKEARAVRCLRLECAPDLRSAIGIVHSPFSSGSTRAALVVLGVDPRSQVVQAVDDAATEAKAGRASPEVAPVAQGGDGARTSSAASVMVSRSRSRTLVWLRVDVVSFMARLDARRLWLTFHQVGRRVEACDDLTGKAVTDP